MKLLKNFQTLEEVFPQLTGKAFYNRFKCALIRVEKKYHIPYTKSKYELILCCLKNHHLMSTVKKLN